MPSKLTGRPSLAYMGVNAPTPPNMVISVSNTSRGITARVPNTNDYNEFVEGDLWIVKRLATDAIPNELWYLARKTGTVNGPEADWVKLYPQAGGGGGGSLRSDDGLIAIPDPANGYINIYGGEPYGGNPLYVNIYTDHYNPADPYTLNVNLKRSINQPITNATASEGMYALGGHDFLHAYGTDTTMCGIDAGNRTLDPILAAPCPAANAACC